METIAPPLFSHRRGWGQVAHEGIFWEHIPWLIQRGYWPPFLPLPLPEKEGLARLNLEVWREAKRRWNQQDPRVKNLWEEFALRLLEEGVL